jgi:hypothetical protein
MDNMLAETAKPGLYADLFNPLVVRSVILNKEADVQRLPNNSV